MHERIPLAGSRMGNFDSGTGTMNKASTIILVIATLLFATGCGNRFWEDSKRASDHVFNSAPTAVPYHQTSYPPMIELNYRAADVLYSNVNTGELTNGSPVFVKDFANEKNPGDTAIFRQVVTQQVADRLVQRKILIKKGEPGASDMFYQDGLTRADYEGKPITKVLPPRSAMLSGGYVISDKQIFMSATIVRLVDSTVISAHNWTLPISDDIRELLPQLETPDEGMEPTVKTSFD